MVKSSWEFIARPFKPSAWRAELESIQSLTPKSFAFGFLRSLPKLSIYYLLLAPIVAMPFYNTMIFHPFASGDFSIKAIDGIACQNVCFKSANGKGLHAWLFTKPGASKTVLLSHGNAGNLTNRVDLVKVLLSVGVSVLAYDYQGFGKSEGSPSIDGICQDDQAAYDYLVHERKVNPADIIIFGESIGTGAASAVAAKNTCAGVILQSPFTSLPAIGREKVPLLRLYPDWLFPANRLDNLSLLKGKHAPLLIVHGEKDTLIPISHAEKIYKDASGPKYFARLPDAGHNDIYYVDSYLYQQALSSFIASLD